MRRRVRGRAPTFAAALSLALLGSVVPLAASAEAAATCMFDADAKTVAVETSQDIAVRRDAAGALSIHALTSPPLVLPCGSPMVTTVDEVTILSSGTLRTIEIDQSAGRFTPGSDTATAGEIRFIVSFTLPEYSGATIRVIGTSAVDTITAGFSGINLDASDDDVADITYDTRPDAVRIEGRGGDDVLSGAGGDGAGPIDGLGKTTYRHLVGGSGDDHLIGPGDAVYDDAPHGVLVDLAAGTATAMPGTANNNVGNDTLEGIGSVRGSRFADRLRGDAERNLLVSGGGRDMLEGRGGDDELYATEEGATADYAGAPGPVSVLVQYLSPVTGPGYSEGADGNDTLINVSSVRGSAFDDRLVITDVGSHLPAIDGSGGADTVDFSGMWGGLRVYIARGEVNFDDHPHQRLLHVEHVVGTPYDDVIVGSSAANVLAGGGGNDRIHGRGGNDTLSGGRGNDVIRPGVGADRIYGGPGGDTVDYSERTAPLRVFINSVANDGEQGERDFVRADVEHVLGGAGDDVIGGSSVRNVLKGGRGADRLFGYGGNDTLWGQLGIDRLSAGDGNDVIYASDNRRDVVLGGNGTDTGHVDPVDFCSSIERRRNS